MRSWLIPLWLVFLLLITIPYLIAALNSGEEYVFGGFLLNLQDGNSYLAKMYQGWRGDWQFTLPFTAQPGEGAYLFLFYLFLGHLARWSGLPLLIVFHAARVLSALALAIALYHFLRALQLQEFWLRRAYTLALLGSGMGWLVFWSGNLTSDFWVVETYPFLSAYSTPHFALGLAILVWLLALPAGPAPGWRKEALAGLAALLLATFSPFGVIVCLVVLSGMAAWLVIQQWLRSQRGKPLRGGAEQELFFFTIRRIIWVCVGGLPLLFYYYWVARSHPALAQWDAQNLTPAPPPVGFAPFAFAGPVGGIAGRMGGAKGIKTGAIAADLGGGGNRPDVPAPGFAEAFYDGLLYPRGWAGRIGIGLVRTQMGSEGQTAVQPCDRPLLANQPAAPGCGAVRSDEPRPPSLFVPRRSECIEVVRGEHPCAGSCAGVSANQPVHSRAHRPAGGVWPPF